MEVGREAAGSTVRVPVGTMLDVRLPENPTTGYRWAVEGGDQAILPLADDRYEPGHAVGAGGTRLLRFRSGQPGRASLHFVHRRQWESDAAGADHFDVHVVVE